MKQDTNEQTCNNNRPHRLVGKSVEVHARDLANTAI